MRAVDAFLLHFDQAWDHKWESLTQTLVGVGPAEADWQAPCYADVEREAGWPLAGTVHWQVAHIAHCKRYYALMLTQRDRSGRPPESPRAPNLTWAQEVVELQAAHAAQRAAIAGLSDADLEARVGNAMGVGEFVAMCTRHDAWHAAQIAVARRLYRTRG